MNYKKGLIVFFLIVSVLFCISSVAASDANDAAIAADMNNNQKDSQSVLKMDESDIDNVGAKESTKISVKTVTGKEKSKVKLSATVKTMSNDPVKNMEVAFKVDGKIYTAKTNYNGIATLSIKVPKTKILQQSTKTKNNIVTKTTTYKKTYTCTAVALGDASYDSSSAHFKLISKKDKKVEKYKIVKKQVKTITIPYKKYGVRQKTVGHYMFAVVHEQREGNRISVAAGDKTLNKLIKFESKAYYLKNGKKVYPWKNKWLNSKKSTDVHEYYYTGEAKIYVIIKYTAYSYKKLK